MTNRKIAITVGALFLIAMVASLVGGSLVESGIVGPDYLVAVSENETQVLLGVLLELVNAIAVVGIGVLMFSILRPYSERIALGYVGFRIIESIFCAVIVIGPLSLVTLGRGYAQAGMADPSYAGAVASLAMAQRGGVAGLLIPVFFGLGATLFYIGLYRSRLLPRFISVWGLVGVILVLILNLLLTLRLLQADVSTGLIFALPMILNEVFLGIWLIVRGFGAPASASVAAPAGADRR